MHEPSLLGGHALDPLSVQSNSVGRGLPGPTRSALPAAHTHMACLSGSSLCQSHYFSLCLCVSEIRKYTLPSVYKLPKGRDFVCVVFAFQESSKYVYVRNVYYSNYIQTVETVYSS